MSHSNSGRDETDRGDTTLPQTKVRPFFAFAKNIYIASHPCMHLRYICKKAMGQLKQLTLPSLALCFMADT
jgi:hypothetical protein